ncbi:protein Jade-3 [Tachyglossus aculeatus]|uniref:protein Jade-3 n=1 Tax=Tachyglossus aculeatus TaxID=9261 RepID=UPI0018F5C3BA|nr:protein Jade-3 [Tachyglossus aculeatus]XP_038613022.1 protein Jade-3 [Tachyglossus aculeatus]XP_038613023.1 protein Jade-3 [Tachyglossus aculeatus]
MKRQRHLSSSGSSDNESPSTSFSSCLKYRSKSKTAASEPKKPAEVFRKDLISAMKLPDSHHVNPEEYYLFADTWKEEWEKGVQVPSCPASIPQPSLRVVAEKVKDVLYIRPRKYIHCSSQEPAEPGYINILELAKSVCRYDLDDTDIFWLQELNEELGEMGCGPVDENAMEKTVEVLERQCHENMNHAIETEEGLGIEYDEDVICDVCRSPDSEDGNDMVFCDKCNICVHQACYGILKVPEGSWLCRTCVLGVHPQCLLCPKRGGAMKATRTGTKWAHVSCALWIPEVSIACPERMEPITKISHIPPSRWALVCSLCKLKTGACIQCSVKSCITAFHVTCAFEHSLEMKTILDEGDEVKFKSHCLKHSKSKPGGPEEAAAAAAEAAPRGPPDPKQAESKKTSLRSQKLRELEEEFYGLVQVERAAAEVRLPRLAVDFIYNYWKLKRKSNSNRPLFPPKEEEENGFVQPKEDSTLVRLRLFMHLRQDLERVRNLCYMVSRREKLKLAHSKVHEQLFNLQVQLINQEMEAGPASPGGPESGLFYPPPRITLKLKMPRPGPGESRTNAAGPGNGLPAPDHGGCPVPGKRGTPPPAKEPPEARAWPRPAPAGRLNGLPGQTSVRNGKLPPGPRPPARPNGLRAPGGRRDSASQTAHEARRPAGPPGFRRPAPDPFGRSFKEASNSLVRSAEDLRACEKPPKRLGSRERLWSQDSPDPGAGGDNDGYCPDSELSDSEGERDGGRGRPRRGGPPREPGRDGGRRGRAQR